MKRKIKALYYKLIRRWVFAYDGFKSVDSREDYVCGHCGEPILRRNLFCTAECYFVNCAVGDNE